MLILWNHIRLFTRCFRYSVLFFVVFFGISGPLNSQELVVNQQELASTSVPISPSFNAYDLERLWHQGLKDYDSGQYELATQGFEQAHLLNPTNGHILYNLGNAYHKSGKLGYALAAYYAARHYLPRDPDLKMNIQFLQKSVEDRLESTLEPPLWQRAFFWLSRITLKESVAMMSVCLTLGFVLLAFAFRFSQAKTWLWGLTIAVWGASAILSLGTWIKSSRTLTWGAISTDTAIHSDKNLDAAVVFKLRDGAPVIVLDPQKDWVKIKLSDGKMGWVVKEHVRYYLPAN